jgi:two-component system cell cycle response regulator
MSELLIEEHQRLKQQLDGVIEQARENEMKMQRFHAQELRLIGTRSLSALIQNILYNYRTSFSLDAVSLILFDHQYEIRRILEEEGTRLAELSNLIFFTKRQPLGEVLKESSSPQLGPFNPSLHKKLFAKSTPKLKSIAVLPLSRYGDLIGSLNLGSINEHRFTQTSATDFLQRLATVLAICLENTINHERLKRVGLTDSLTGINNRRFFDQRIGEEIARALRTREPLSCLLIDIDHFKRVNDTYGHQTGDDVLRQTAGLIREQLRNSDVLARYGGEEFAVVLPNTSSRTAFDIAQRIQENISQQDYTVKISGGVQALSVRLSMGVATMATRTTKAFGAFGVSDTLPGDIEPLIAHLIRNADNALYEAKSAGRNCVMVAKENSLAS